MFEYKKFKKINKKNYSEVTHLLKESTHFTAREWVIARLCADFKNVHGQSEMTWIGENLPDLVPFFHEPYSRQEVSNARASFKRKLERSGTSLFYSYYSGLITRDEMLEVITNIIKNIGVLLDMEDTPPDGDHTEGVQNIMVDVLRRINSAFEEEA